MKRISIMLLALFLINATAIGEEKIPSELEPGASASLAVFKTLVTTRNNFRDMGFESVAELERMALGVPMKMFLVQLDQLQAYHSGIAPETILVDSKHYLYPVLVETNTRSSLTMREIQGNWSAVSFGSPKLARMLTKARAAISSSAGVPLSSIFVVEIPALNMYFVGYKVGPTTMLTQIMEDGSTVSPRLASAVFSDLVPMAKAHDGLPR
jgi:hypothetical protein